jgi:alpha-beta hydrolase superfamily lysophospholipase
MPPDLAQQLASHSKNPDKQLLIVPGARHGQAFAHDRDTYLRTSFDFLDRTVK